MAARVLPLLTVGLCSLAAASPARAQDQQGVEPKPSEQRPPPTGTGLLVTGVILTGASFFVVPAIVGFECFPESRGGAASSNTCAGVMLGAGLAFLATGVTLAVIGGGQRHRYLEWRNDHLPPTRIRVIEHVSLAPTPGGFALGWYSAF